MLKRILVIFSIFAIISVAVGAWIFRPISVTHSQLAETSLPSIIPLRALYADADARWRYQLSPDGSKLSWLESKWFKPALWVKSLEGHETNVIHTDDEVRWYAWSGDSRHLLYQADRDGWENDVLVSVDTKAPEAKPKSYDFGKDVKSFFYKIPDDAGPTVLIAHNGRDRSRFDLYRLNLLNSKTESMDLSVEEGVNWHVTSNGKIYARTRFVNGADWRFEMRETDGWREVVKGTFEDIFAPISDPDKMGRVYAISNLGRDKSALVQFDLNDSSEEIIDQHTMVDYGNVIINSKTQTPMMAMLSPGYQKRRFFDDAYKTMIDKLKLPENSAVHIISSTRDNSKLLVTIQEAEAGFETKLIDRTSGKISSISKPGIANYRDQISPVKPVFIQAKDGLTIPAFVSTPKGANGPVPMVIIIHGGPTSRAYWGWNALRVWLNNRGYAVLDVNYRSSSGYGRKFREAAIGEVSRKMDQDITDARQWAIDEGIADPAKIAVFGGSFGGLKVLTAMTRHPDMYAAGIDINGISDIVSMLKEVPVYWRGWPDWYRKYIGNPENIEEKKEIADRSPLNHADQLKNPLLIIQGSNDVRVVRNQAERMVEALKLHNAPYEYVLLRGAGHQYSNWGWKQRIVIMRKMERFLAKHLGGRADGFDYAILGAHVLDKF